MICSPFYGENELEFRREGEKAANRGISYIIRDITNQKEP